MDSSLRIQRTVTAIQSPTTQPGIKSNAHCLQLMGSSALGIAISDDFEVAARIAGHESTRTTQLYNGLREEISLDEVERIHI